MILNTFLQVSNLEQAWGWEGEGCRLEGSKVGSLLDRLSWGLAKVGCSWGKAFS